MDTTNSSQNTTTSSHSTKIATSEISATGSHLLILESHSSLSLQLSTTSNENDADVCENLSSCVNSFQRRTSLDERIISSNSSDVSTTEKKSTHKRILSAPHNLTDLKIISCISDSNEIKTSLASANHPNFTSDDESEKKSSEQIGESNSTSKRKTLYPSLDFITQDSLEEPINNFDLEQYHQNAIKKLQEEKDRCNVELKKLLVSSNSFSFSTRSTAAHPCISKPISFPTKPQSCNTNIVWSNMAVSCTSHLPTIPFPSPSRSSFYWPHTVTDSSVSLTSNISTNLSDSANSK